MDSPELRAFVGEENKEQLLDEVELLDGATADFDQELREAQGKLSPGILRIRADQLWRGDFLKHFLQMTSTPLPREADCADD